MQHMQHMQPVQKHTHICTHKSLRVLQLIASDASKSFIARGITMWRLWHLRVLKLHLSHFTTFGLRFGYRLFFALIVFVVVVVVGKITAFAYVSAKLNSSHAILRAYSNDGRIYVCGTYTHKHFYYCRHMQMILVKCKAMMILCNSSVCINFENLFVICVIL